MGRRITPVEDRFWSKVDRRGDDECWPWLAGLSWDGYGKIGRGGAGTGDAYAHVVAYELRRESVRQGMELDHLCCDPAWCSGGPTCPHRRCCNPRHLEQVTHAENMRRGNGPIGENARKTHCPQGHELTGGNLYLWRGHRDCLRCRRDRSREYQRQRRARLKAERA